MQTIEYASQLGQRPVRPASVIPLVLWCLAQTAVGVAIAAILSLFGVFYSLLAPSWWVCMGLTTLLYLVRRLHIAIVCGVALAVTVSPVCVMIHEIIVRGVPPFLVTLVVVAAVMNLIALRLGVTYRRPRTTVEFAGRGRAADAWGNPL